MKFWTCGTISMRHLLTVNIAREFQGHFDETEATPNDDDSEEDDVDWPPFRKVSNRVLLCEKRVEL